MASSAKFIDTVKAEAVFCYQKTSRLKTVMTVLVACSVLLVLHSCCSGSSLSLSVDSAVYHSLGLLHLFRRPLWAFLLSNAIIIAVAILSVTDDARRKTRTAPEFSDRIYDELEVSRVSSASTVTAAGAAGERRHRRTRSAALTGKSCQPAGDRASRRSMTENWRRTAGCRPVRGSVAHLSNEEFNRMVENYIKRTRSFLKMELMADCNR